MNDQTLNPAPSWGRDGGFVNIGDAPLPASTEQLLDRVRVLDVLSRYAFSYDERAIASLRSVFTDDAVFEGNVAGGYVIEPVVGGDTVVEWLEGFMQNQTDQRRHNVTNVLFTAQTDSAVTVHAFLLLTSCSNGVTSHVTSGFYVFDLVKVEGAWKIKRIFGGFDNSF